MIDRLASIVSEDSVKRREKIINILNENKVEYELQSSSDSTAINIVVRLNSTKESEEVVVIGAHYDVYKKSKGINDNGCAVVALLEFILRNKDKEFSIPLEIVFFDMEETGMIGSTDYINENGDRIKYSIILDIIAFGDKLLYGSYYGGFDYLFSGTNVFKVDEVLPSDNVSFELAGIPSALITAAPNEDLIEKENGDFKFKPYPTFYSSFHNRKNDNDMEVINTSLMEETIKTLDSLFIVSK